MALGRKLAACALLLPVALRAGGGEPGRRAGRGPIDRWRRDDRDGDGSVTREEFTGPGQIFGRLDRDGDGAVSEDEIRRFEAARRGGARALPPGVEVLRDVVYGTGGGRDLTLDVYRPTERPAAPMPALVWIHGGAWRGGDKGSGSARLAPFAGRGFFCASISYRLTRESTFPAQIEDCKCAVRYLRAHAAEYGLDPERVGVWGSSAGGHLAAMLGTTGGVEGLEGSGGWAGQSSRVQAVCDWYGPSDLVAMVDQPSNMDHGGPGSPEGALVGGPVRENPDRARRASPITYVDAGDPPFLIMHGTRDMTVPFGQSEMLHEALRAAGVDVSFLPVEGAGHGGPGFVGEEVQRRVAGFFERHLASAPASKPLADPRAPEAAEPAPEDTPAPCAPVAEAPAPGAASPGAEAAARPRVASALPWIVAALVTAAAVGVLLLWLSRKQPG